MTDDDTSDWEAYTEEVDKTVQSKRSPKVKPTKSSFKTKDQQQGKDRLFSNTGQNQIQSTRKQNKTILPEISQNEISGVDKNTAKKLKNGTYPIDQTIDLHGLTKDQAFQTLLKLIPQAQQLQHRCLLIITGKGIDKQGVIKTNIKNWLNHPQLRPLIITCTYAARKHGGEGAIYVLLKRR